jgi:hypothetical protein
MGRRHLSRALLVAAAVAAVFAGVATAGLSWHEITAGSTTQSSQHTPKAYLALTPAQEKIWLSRLGARDRTTVRHVALTKTVLVAAFLDGAPCSTHVLPSSVTRVGRTIVLTISYRLPPVGVALCVRASTPYVVVGITRASLGGVRPTRVSRVLHPRT